MWRVVSFVIRTRVVVLTEGVETKCSLVEVERHRQVGEQQKKRTGIRKPAMGCAGAGEMFVRLCSSSSIQRATPG